MVDFCPSLLSSFEVQRIAVRNMGGLSMLWFGFFHSLIRVIHIVIRGGGNYENMGRGRRRNIGRAGFQPSSPVLSFYFADPSLLLSISLKCHLEMREKLRTRYY